ncbi:MAG: homocysteine S-methyltransferase family protein [Limnochordia bacterium]|jgi:5-methyltetrahydrofolate--homocysteine methyltransferase
MLIRSRLQEPLLFDGAMGTMLQHRSDLAFPELNNLKAPDVVSNVHRVYLEAGADVVETNTFGANRFKLAQHGYEEHVWEINEKAARLAKSAASKAGKDRLVAGSMGPTGQLMAPLGTVTFDEVYEAYRTQAQALAAGGVDLIIVETMLDLAEARAALLGALSTGLSVIAQMTFEDSGLTMMGTSPQVAACVLSSLGASVVGANCGLGPAGMLNIIEAMAPIADSVSVMPNAGLPKLVDGVDFYELTPEEMASYVPQFIESGANIIGGCCGTTPKHIELMRQSLCHISGRKPTKAGVYTASSRQLVQINLGQRAKECSPDDWMQLADEDCSLLVLRNPEEIGMLQMMCPVPFVFVDVSLEKLETLLKEYNGRALVVPPCTPNESGFHVYAEVAKKFGAILVLDEYQNIGMEVAVKTPVGHDVWWIETGE